MHDRNPARRQVLPQVWHPRPAGRPGQTADVRGALPSKGPIPRVGKLFIASLFVGLVLLALGIADVNPLFLYAGGGILAVVAMGLIVGHHVS